MKKLAAIAALFLFTACTSSPTPSPVTSTNTPIPPSPTEPAVIEPTPTPLPTPTNTPEPTETELPRPEPIVIELLSNSEGTPPVIDGRITDGEWDSAIQTTLSDGSLVHWLYTDGHLYVGIHETAVGAVNLAIDREPGQLWIMHASAALGSLIYEQEGESWKKVQDWDWCCRSYASTAADALYETESWRSMITSAGVPGNVEYQVLIAPGEYQTAIMFIFADNSGNTPYFPPAMSPDTAKQLRGPFPETVSFSLDEWVTLIITD